jgi:hypothetical protein
MSNDAPEIFVYKMVVDNGGAPCVASNLLSLAICKPKIRKAAGKGVLVFGFGCKKYDERLIYIARVTDQLAGENYYRLREYARRPDCIYKSVNGKSELKKTAKFHTDSDHRKRDVGLKFENAYVLLSRDFRYFGKRGTPDYKNDFPNLKKLVEGLKRGHRNHLNPDLRKELLELKNKMWKKNKRMKIGIPTDADFRLSCNTDCPSASC